MLFSDAYLHEATTKKPLKIERFQRIITSCVYLGSRVRACVYKCINAAVLRAQKNEE